MGQTTKVNILIQKFNPIRISFERPDPIEQPAWELSLQVFQL
jgi:hypothetical protein